MAQRLTTITKKLVSLFNQDARSWHKVYDLLLTVRNEKLYKPKYHSFTAWVKDFSRINHIAESTIWRKFKAGQVYTTFTDQQHANGVKLDNIVSPDQLKISEDNLVTIGKIANNDYKKTDQLLSQVKDGELSRQDLREAYKSVAPTHHVNGTTAKEKAPQNKATEADLTLLITKNQGWLKTMTNTPREQAMTVAERPRAFKRYIDDKYKAFAQFPVLTGTTRHARRIDVLVTENQTTDYRKLSVHAFEIKVDPNDLKNDHKYTEYMAFVNYLWVIVTDSPEMVSMAKQVVPHGVGIMTANVKNQQIKILQQANRLDPERIAESLTTALIKSI